MMPVNVFVVVNGKLSIEPATVSNELIPIALRSLDALLTQSANAALYQIEYELAQHTTISAEGAEQTRITPRYTYIPGDYCVENSSLDFDPEAMKRLADQGALFGARQEWFDFPPDAQGVSCESRAVSY